MTHGQFITANMGRYVDYDKRYGNQCVDLMRQYIKDVEGIDPYQAVPAGATAKTIFQNFSGNKYYQKILNSPSNVPKKGDLVFWGYYPSVTGWAGHVGVFDSGDLYSVVVFNQNYPTGSSCQLRKFGTSKLFHGYRGVMGWLRRKV